MQCINCTMPAVWVFKATGVAERGYCNPHLPAAYRGTRNVTPADAVPVEVVFEDNVKPEAFESEDPSPAPVVKKSRARKPDPVEEPVEE
jgi:hypothetical protein